MTERHGRTLARLAEAGLALALDLQDRALAAKTAEEAAQLAKAFHQVSRTVRMSVTLEAKLERGVVEAERAAAREAAEVREAQVERRCELVKAAVERACWDQNADDETSEWMADEAGERLDALRDEADFLDGPIEAQIERLTLSLGLKVGEEGAAAKEAARVEREAAPDWSVGHPDDDPDVPISLRLPDGKTWRPANSS